MTNKLSGRTFSSAGMLNQIKNHSKKYARLIWRANSVTSGFGGSSSIRVREDTRKVVTRKPHRKVGRIYIPRLQSFPVSWESELELSFIKQAICCPGVASVQSEPFTLELLHEDFKGLRKIYSPDFLISFGNGHQLIAEVRHSSRLEQDVDFFQIFSKHAQEAGYSFAVFTEQTIRRHGCRLENSDLLYRYSQKDSSAHQDLFDELGEPFVGTLLDLCDLLQVPIFEGLSIVANNNFDFDLDQDIENSAILAALDGEVGDEYFFSENWF